MENQKSTAKQIMLNNGMTLGIILVIISVANFALGDIYKPHWVIQVVSILIMIAFIVLGIKKLKESNNNLLSLGQALKTSVGISLIASIIILIYMILFANFIEPNYIENLIEVNRANMIENSPNVSDDMLDIQANGTRDYFYPFLIGGVVIWNIFLGFIFGLIAGLIMKKSDEEITSI
ncbi:MAG: DUF4199 domain-containing protein [Lutibacter sp.]|nr:DUF4199 domain-containing protein [Lutibacter sp.]